MTDDTPGQLERLDHVAIEADDVPAAVEWYRRHFRCDVEWQDDSWAMLRFANVKLAIVTPGKHPPHVAFERDDAASFGTLHEHRDGSRSVYLRDSAGNHVEIVERR